jgi:hypothetical protein
METAPNGDVVVRVRGPKAVGMILLGIMMTALMAWMLGSTASTTRPLWFLRGVGAFGTLFFGAGTLWRVYKWISGLPALVIDHEGIFDRCSWTAVGRIRWPEIAGFRIESIRSVNFIAIDVHHPSSFVARGNVLQRALRSINAGLIGTPVSIASVDLDIGRDELLATLRRFFDQSKDGRVSPSA